MEPAAGAGVALPLSRQLPPSAAIGRRGVAHMQPAAAIAAAAPVLLPAALRLLRTLSAAAAILRGDLIGQRRQP